MTMMMEEEKTCTNSVVHSNGSHLEPKLEPTNNLIDLEDQAPRNLAQGAKRHKERGATHNGSQRRAIKV